MAAIALVATLLVATQMAGARVGSATGWLERTADESIVFEDVATELGIAEKTIDAWGIAVADVNLDGWDDIYLGRHGTDPHLYYSHWPSPFTDEVWRLHLLMDKQRKLVRDRHTMAIADYDGDRRIDIYVPTGGGRGVQPGFNDQLYHQLPNGEFEDVAGTLGITDKPGSGRVGIWWDYDADGDLDLFLGRQPYASRPETSRNVLWRNPDFTDIAAAAGIDAQETSFAGLATDINGDDDLDLLTIPGQKMSIYLSNGDGTFSLGSTGKKSGSGLSVSAGDYDNDGDQDLLLGRSNPSQNLHSMLLRNEGGMVFTNVTEQAGADYNNQGPALFVDVNNDGWLDVYVVRQSLCCPHKNGPKQPNLLLINQQDGTFIDIAAEAGVAGPLDNHSETRNTGAWGDFNNDGLVDFAINLNTKNEPFDSVFLYINRTVTDNGWFTLRLNDPTSLNWQAFHAKVWIKTGSLTQYREVNAATAHHSQSPPYLMVGVGAATTVDELKIRWPDGTIEVYTDVAVDRHLVATKGGGLTERVTGSPSQR